MRQPVPFGKYLLLDRISVGGMAEVFKAKSYGVEGFEKIIAIKRILPTMGEDRDFIKMFIDEAKIAGQLAHANICQIFELGRIDGSHFIAMEFIWGKDLLQIQNRVRKNKQAMPIPMACFIIAKVLEGLDYAHRKRDPLGRPLEIVHRDCSPQNVLVSYEGEVKVIDFGIAKATSRNSRTMAGVLKGKFGYMSPEQVRGLPLDRRSDIFALGTMLYECLTGERLFQGETDFSTLEKVRNVDVQNPRAINPNIPEAVERVILKALAKDVDDRYQWCSDMLADLQQFLMSQDVVFTAKSLSAWLKEQFTGELDRERQQLEQYKRVGRDGLIAGVPAAEAKVDVVATLGEAGLPEGDATQLGGPSFDELEQIIAAAGQPQVGPASSQRAVPTTPPEPAPAPAAASAGDDDGDFGEEAPTEIFGDEPGKAPPPPAVAPVAARAPSSGVPAQKQPPKPPPGGRSTTQGQPIAAAASPGSGASPMPRAASIPPAPPPLAAPQAGPLSATMPAAGGALDAGGPSAGGYAPAHGSGPSQTQPPPYGQPNPSNPYSAPQQFGYGTPGAMPTQQPQNALAQPGPAPAKTLMGQPTPAAGNYGQTYRVTGQQPAYNPQGYPSQQQMPQYGQPYPVSAMNPSQPHMQYGAGAYGQTGPMPPVDQTPQPTALVGEKKKSSIGRDVAIGVAIAAVVLGGFLAVKFLVLDNDGDSGTAGAGTSAPTSSIATIKLSLPKEVAADLYVDDKKIGTFRNDNEVPVSAGTRKVKLVGPNDSKCEQNIELPGGKTTPVQCALKGADVPATGTTAGSGSAAAATTDKPNGAVADATKPADAMKPADTKVETPAGDKPADKAVATTVDKPADKATVDKPADKAVSTTTSDKTVAKPTDKTTATATTTTTKPADKPADKTTKPADKATTTTKPTDKSTTSTKPTDTRAKPAADTGWVLVTSKPAGAKILVDNIDTGMTTPTSKIQLTPGRHKVSFVRGGDKFTFPVNVKAGETITLSKDLPN